MTRILDGEEQRELDFSNQQGASSNESLDPSNTGEYTTDDADDKGAVDPIKVDPDPVNTTKVDPDPVDPDPVAEKPRVGDDVNALFDSGYDPREDLDNFIEENYYDDDPMGEIGITSSTGLTPEQAATIQKSGYTGSLNLGDDPNLKLAAEQGDARAIFNSFGKMVAGTFGEIVATPGYISEAVEDWRGTQDGYSNILIEAKDEIMEAAQDFSPVYLDRGDIGTLDVLNGEWWASHIEQLGPTMALLAVGLATDGLLTPTIMRGFAATAKGVNDLKLAQTILSQGSKVNTKLRAGVSATTSRLMEGTMEAYQVQQASREKYRKEGKSEEEAIALSSEDAKQAMTANMALVLMDAFQFNLAFKGLAGLSAGAKALHGTKNLAINMATEAIEEGIQHIITEKSIGEQSFSEGRAVSDIVGDEEFTKAMESGAFGGVVFAAGGPAINKATESIRYASSKEYRAKVDKMKEKEEIRLESVRLMEESYKAMVDGKVNKSEYLNDKLFDKTVLDALNNGTEDSLSQSLNDRLKLSDDELSKMGSKSIMGLDVTPREFLENKKEVVDAIIAKKKELQDFYGRDSENADISNDLLNAHMSAISMSNNLKFANKHKAKLEAEAAKVTSKNSATLNEAIEAKDKYDGLSDMIDKKTEETKRYNEYISKLENEESNDEAVNELKARIRHEEILLEELILARDNTKKTVDERKKLLTKEEKTLYSNHMPGKLASTVANIEALNYYNNLAQAEIKTKSKPEYRNKKEIEQADMMFQQLNVESELIQARKKFSNKNKKIDRLLKNRIDDIRKEKEGNSTSQQRQKAADAINEAKEAKERIRIAEEEAKKQKVKIKNRAQAINSSSDIFTNEDIDGLSDSSRESRNAGIERLNASLEDELTRLDNLSDEDFSRDRTTRAKENSELEKRYAYELNIINSTAINQTINDSNNLKKDDTATIDYFNEKKAASLENAKRGLYIDREIRRIHDEITNSVNTIESEIQDISLRIANNKESESDIQDKALLTSRLIEAKEALTEFEKVKVFDLIKEYYLNLSSALKEEINKREQQKKIQNEKLNNQIAISKTMSLSEDGNHYTNESGDLYDRQSNYVREKRNNTEDLKNNYYVINSLIGGNIIDSIGRDVFSNSGKTRSKKEHIAEALKKYEKEYGKKKFTMSDKHFDNIVKMITDYKNSFPEGTKFYSNDITVFKDYAKPKVNSKGETIKGVAGVIDLLVQTPDGNFHIVDFKSQQIKRTKKSLLIFKNKFKSKAELSNEVFNNPFNNEVSQLEKWGDQQTVYEYLIDLDIESINIMLIPYGYSHDDSGIEVLRTYDSADILDINEDNSSDISDNIIKLESSSFIGDNFENDFEKIYEPKDTEVKDTEVKDDPSKENDLKPANEGDIYSIKVTNKKTKEEVDVNVIFSDGQWRKQKTNGKPYAKALPQAKQDFINEKRRQEELASELDASEQLEQQTSEVTAEMWNTFVDTGKVPQDKVNDIANKIKLGNTLSDKELAIRTTYAKEIEKLLSQPTQQASEVVKSPLEGVSDSAIAEMSDENYKELVETGYTTWLGKNGETNDAAYKPQQTKQTIEVEVVVTNKRYSRKSLDADPDSMYLFTDNAERTSRPTASSPNITEGWYAEKYKDKTNKPLHYGSTSNPTSAVIRGKNNAYPVSTMSAYGTNWTNKNFDLFKDTIDDEIAQIKQDLPKFKTLKLGDFRIGQGGRFAKLPSQHQSYLDSKLLELGIDNSGNSPKVIQPAQQSNGAKVKDNQSDASIDGINNIPENTKPSFKRNAASKLAKILQSRRKDSSSDFSFQSIISELKDQVPGEYISIQEFVDIINESNPNLRISMDSVNNKFIVTKVKKDKSKDKDTTNVNSTKKDTTDTTDNINDRSNDNNSTVLDIHDTVTSETNSLDNVYTSSTAKATAKASADQMALKGLDDSDLKVKEDKADYTKIAYRVKDWNNKIKEDANLDMLDFNKVNVGTEVTFELADGDSQIINIYVDGKRKKTTWGDYSKDLSKDSDDYLSNLPIKILVGGKQVAYVPVYTQRKGDTAEYTESFIRFRANIIKSIDKYGKDAVSSSIVSRTYGKLNLQNEASSVLDNMPDVEIGIYTSNGFSGVHSSISEDNITNSGILTYGHYYALTPADVGEYTAIPITPKKINKNIATAIAMAADVFISRQHTSQSTEVLNKMGSKYDLTTRSGVNNYIRLFTYPISAENSGKAPAGFISQFEKEVYDKDTNFNAISIDEFGISWAQGSQKSKENPAASNKITKKDKRNDKQYAKKMNNLIAHLQLMYHQMDTSVINDKFPKGIVLLRGKENGKQRNAQLLEVREEGIARTITYREMIQRLYVTNVKADLIGNEDGKDKYSYRFQSVMHLDENIKIKDLKTNKKTTLLEVKRDEIKKKKKKKKKKKGTSKAQKQKDIDIAKKREALANALTHAERTSVDDKADRTDQMALTNTESTVVLIDGLTAGTQRELILSIAESFARKIFKGKTTSISKDDETRIYNEWKSDLNILMEISTLDINSLGKYSKLKKKDKLKYSELKANIRRLNAAIENFDTVIDMTMNYLGSKSTMTVRSVDGEMTRSDKAGEMIKKQLGDSKTMESTGKHTMSAELKRFLHFVKDYKFEDGVPVVKKNWVGKDMYMPADKAFNTLQSWIANKRPNYKEIMSILEDKTKKHPWVEGFIEMLNNASEKNKREFIVALNNHSVNMDFVMWSKTRDEYKVRIYSDNFNSLYREKLSEWNNLMRSNLVNVVNSIEYYDTNKVEDIIGKINRLEKLSKNTPLKNTKAWEQSIDVANFLYLKEIFEDIGIEVVDDIISAIVTGNYYSKGKRISFINQFKGGSLLRSIRNNIIKTLNKEEGTDKFESYGALDNSAVIELAKVAVRDIAETGTTSFRVDSKPIQGYTNNHFLSNTFMDLHDGKLTEKLEKFAYNKYSSWIEYMRSSEGSNMFNFRYISLNPLKQKGSKNKNSSSLGSRVSKEHEVIKLGMFHNAGQMKKFIHIDEDSHRTEKPMRNAIYFYSTTSDKSKVMLVNGIAHDVFIDTETRIVKEETVDHIINTIVASEIARIGAHQNTDFNHKGYDEGKNLFLIFPLLNNIPNIRDNDGKLIKDVLAIPGMRDQFRKVITEYVASQVNSKLAEWDQMGIAIKEDADNANTYTYIDSGYVKHAKTKVGNNSETIRAFMANDFVINNLFAQHNYSTIVQGDIAQYYKQHPSNKGKSITDESYNFEKDSQETYENLGKRLAGDVAPGYETYNSDEAPDIRMGLLEDRLSKSEVYEYLKSALKLADSDSYGKIESADAQEFTTWKEHLTVMYNTGKIEEVNYKRMMKSNGYFDDEDLAIILQPMKPVYVGNVLDNQVWRRYYIKSSSFPLLPQLTKGLQLDKLRMAMESQNVDRVAFGTAVKVGNVKTPLNIYVYTNIQGNTISDKEYKELPKEKKKEYFQSEEIRDDIVFELDKNVKLLPRKHMRIQQDIPYDGKKNKVTHSGQVAHNVFVNVQTILQQNPETAGLFKEFNSLYGELHNYHMASFLEKMEYKKDGSYDKKKLQEIIVKEAIERNFSINDKIGLGIVERVDEQTGKEFLDFEKPIWDAVSGTKMESLLMSLVDNKVRKLKFPGMSGVLGTEDGFSALDLNEYNTEVLEGDAGQAKINELASPDKRPKGIPVKSKYKGKIIFANSGVGKSVAANMNDGIIDTDTVLADIIGTTVPEMITTMDGLSKEEVNAAYDTLKDTVLELKEKGWTILTPSERLAAIVDVAIMQSDPFTSQESTQSKDRENPYTETTLESKTRINRAKRRMKLKGVEVTELRPTQYLADELFEGYIPKEHITRISNELDDKLVSFLANFGIEVRTMKDIKENLGIDSLGALDLLNKIAIVEDGDYSQLPEITGKFVSHMMQHNPTTGQIRRDIQKLYKADDIAKRKIRLAKIKKDNPNATDEQMEALVDEMNKQINKESKARAIEVTGELIGEELNKRYNREVPKSLRDKIKKLVKDFLDMLGAIRLYKINQNVGSIVNEILRDNSDLITASRFKPGAPGKVVGKVDLNAALEKDTFAKEITEELAKRGFILTGSVTLAEQGTVLRPTENQVHDLDWITDKSKGQVKKIINGLYPGSVFVRDIQSEDYLTTTYISPPKGHTIADLTFVEKGRAIKSYRVLNEKGVEVGTYEYIEPKKDNQGKTIEKGREVPTGVEPKLLDFFQYDKNMREHDTHKLSNGQELKIAKWQDTFNAKLSYSRLKDIWDYNRFRPFETAEKYKDTTKPYAAKTKKYSKQKGIIFTDKFKGKLQPMRRMSTNDPTKHATEAEMAKGEFEILPAQIICKNIIRDKKGNTVDILNFVNDNNILDTSKIPSEILELFGFRIPNQAHSSMSYIEIVGFLPTGMGDLIIAPKDFVTQMGSDFDVDKLYSYMRNHIAQKGTDEQIATLKELYKRANKNKEEIQRYNNRFNEENIDDLREDLLSILEKENIEVIANENIKFSSLTKEEKNKKVDKLKELMQTIPLDEIKKINKTGWKKGLPLTFRNEYPNTNERELKELFKSVLQYYNLSYFGTDEYPILAMKLDRSIAFDEINSLKSKMIWEVSLYKGEDISKELENKIIDIHFKILKMNNLEVQKLISEPLSFGAFKAVDPNKKDSENNPVVDLGNEIQDARDARKDLNLVELPEDLKLDPLGYSLFISNMKRAYENEYGVDLEYDESISQLQNEEKIEKAILNYEGTEKNIETIASNVSISMEAINQYEVDKLFIEENQLHKAFKGVGDSSLLNRLLATAYKKFAKEDFLAHPVGFGPKSFLGISESYQKRKYLNGTAGKRGIATFSNAGILNAAAQGKEIKISKLKLDNIKFGDLTITGDVAGTRDNYLTINESGVKKYISEVISAIQSAAVDNENERILEKINAHPSILNTINGMLLLGLDEQAIVSIIAQDAVIDFIREYTNMTSSLNSNAGDPTTEAINNVIAKYSNNIESRQKGLSTDKEERRRQMSLIIEEAKTITDDMYISELKEYIAKGPSIKNYDEVQISILYKFKRLMDAGDSIKKIIEITNTDSKGLPKSVIGAIIKRKQLMDLHFISEAEEGVRNADKLLGEFLVIPATEKYDDDSLLKVGSKMVDRVRYDVFLKPTTIKGHSVVSSLNLVSKLYINDTVGHMFPYTSGMLYTLMDRIAAEADMNGVSLEASESFYQEIFSGLKSYLYTKALTQVSEGAIQNPSEERQSMLYDIKTSHRYETDPNNPNKEIKIEGEHTQKSFAYEMQSLKKHPVLKDLTIIQRIHSDIKYDGSASKLMFNATSQEDHDESLMYASFEELLKMNKNIEGKPYTTATLAMKLVKYAILTGGIQKATQFVKYIPNWYLKKIGFNKIIRETDFNSKETYGIEVSSLLSDFAKQFFQHNSSYTNQISHTDMTEVQGIIAGKNGKESFDIKFPKNLRTAKQMYGKIQRFVVRPESPLSSYSYITVRLFNGDTNLFMRQEDGSHMRINKLGETGVLEYDATVKDAMSNYKKNGSADTLDKYERDIILDALDPDSNESLNPISSDSIPGSGVIIDKKDPFNLNSNDINSVLTGVINNSKKPHIVEYAKELQKAILSKDENEEYVYDISIEAKNIQNVNGDSIIGQNIRDKKFFKSKVEINNTISGVDDMMDVAIVHEMNHAVVGHWIDEYIDTLDKKGKKKLIKGNKEATRLLKRIHNFSKLFDERMKERHGDQKWEAIKEELMEGAGYSDKDFMNLEYAAKNLKEFAALATTSSRFRKYMNDELFKPEKEGKAGESLYDLFISLVKKLMKALNIDKNSKVGDLVYSDIIELTKLRPVQEKIKKTSKPKKSPTKNVERFKVTDVYSTSTEDFTDMAIDYDGKNYLLQLDSSGTILEAYRQINGELINVDLSYFTFNKDEIGQIFSEIEEIKKDKSTDQMALIQDPNDMNEGRPRKRVVGSDDNRIIDPNESGIGNPNNNRMIDPNETYGNNNNRRKKKESLKLSDEDIEQQLKFDALKKRYLKSKKDIDLNISNNRTQQKVNKGKKGKEKVNEKLDLELKILYRKKEKLEENIEFISEALKVEDVIDLFDSQIEDFNTLLDDNENLSASVLARVRTELDVIIKVGTFEVNVDTHPLLNKKEMKSSKLKSKFITMSNTASEVRDRVTGLIEYEIRNNMREVFNKPDLTLAQLKGKIKDVSSMKGHAMGLSRMDDTLVSGISKSFQDTYNAAHIEGYKINQKVDSLIFAATPYLKKLNNKNLFHPLLQLDRFGEYTGKLITPFSDKYEIERSDAMALKIGLEGKAKINAIKADLKWRKNNEIVMDPRKLFPTDLNTYSNYKYDTETFKQSEIDSHIAELKEHLGDRLYNYYYKKLEQKIKDFNSEYLIKLDNVNSDNTKDASAKANSMKYWNLENSPYVEAKLHNKGESITLNPRTTKSRVLKRKGRRHSIFVPRKFTYSAKRTKVNTGYYDTKFSNLEKSNEVYELYEYFRDVLSDLYDMLPDHHRYNMSRNSLMFVKNKAMENALSNGIFDIGTPKKVYDALYDSLINDVRTNASEEVTSHDDFTGKLDPKVRLNIVDENKLINKEFTADLIQWTVDNKEIYKYFSGTLANFELNPFTFTKFLRTLKTSKTRDKLKAIGFDSLKVRQELLDIKTKSKRKVIKDKNLDIGTIIKVFAKTVVSFHHKAKVQDINNLAVEMSNDKNVEGDQTNLLALLNYSRDVYFGLPARKPEYITDTIIYTKEEKVKMKEYDKLIKEITDGYDDKDKANKDPRVISLINERNQLGQKYVPSGHIDQVLRFVQFKSMAWNLGSGVANMTFGTMANFLEAVEGRLFNVDQLLDAYKLVLGNSSVRNITFNKVTSDTASKIRGIMDGLDLSKDASDELSKASNASSKNRWWSDGFQIQKRTEYVNQATIMIAVFKNKPIKDVSTEYKGDKAMWEAFDKDGNWNTKEFGEEPDLASFSTYVDHVIAKIHGNYNFQDPILLKKYVLGRAVIQFKTWMIEGVATRFEETKDDEILGIVRKGRYRTVLNGAVMGNLDSKDHNPISRLAFLKTAIFEILNRNARVLSLGKLKKDVVSNSNMDNMTDYDAANLKAAVFEFTTLLAFTKSAALLIYMLTDAGDDDPESNKKKSSAFNFILNNLNKAEQDIWAYTSWETYSKIGKTVAPAAGLFIDAKAWVVSLMRLLDDDDTNDTFDRGPFRDENKALNKGLMFTPGLNNIPKMRRLFADSPYSKEFDDMLEMIDELTEDEND